MSSFIQLKDKKIYFEYLETEDYLIHGKKEMYKFDVDKNSLFDLSHTYHAHVKHFQNLESNQFQKIIDFLSKENTYPFEMEEEGWIEMGLKGLVTSISETEVIVSLSEGQLHIDFTIEEELKYIVINYFDELDIKINNGCEIDIDETYMFLFLTSEQRDHWIKIYIDKIEKLNLIYSQNDLNQILLI